MFLSHSSRNQLTSFCLAGAVIAGYLASYQLGLLHSVWDPFFGAGSEIVLRSPLSRALPLPDALLGSFGYATEALCVRTLDWKLAHALYIIIALAMGAGALILVAYQLIVVQTLCTLCLVSAGISCALLVPAFATLRKSPPRKSSRAFRDV